MYYILRLLVIYYYNVFENELNAKRLLKST